MCGKELVTLISPATPDELEPEVWEEGHMVYTEWVHAADLEEHCVGKASVATPDVEDDDPEWRTE